MKTLKTLAAVSVAAFALSTTATAAQAGDYRKCKDTEAAIAGGVIGGSLGTIIGEEIAGRGDKTEGAILGAVIGGIAGAAIGDGASDCEKDGRVYTRSHDGRYYPRATTDYRPSGYRTVSHPGHGHRGYRDRGYRDRDYRDRGYRTDYGYGYDRGDRYRERQLRQINRQIQDLRFERNRLKERARYEGHRRWIDRRLSEIAYDLDRLKRDRKRLKRSDYRRDRRGHYHGSNICYSDH